MNEPHHKLILDLDACTAEHECGLSLRFLKSPPTSAEDVVLSGCFTADWTNWHVVITVDNMRSVFDRLVVEHGQNNAHRMIVKMGREAGHQFSKLFNKKLRNMKESS